MIRPPPRSPLFPYTPLSRSQRVVAAELEHDPLELPPGSFGEAPARLGRPGEVDPADGPILDELVPDRARLARCVREDRKSTRLNSSHDQISYAVFCLKKKKN